MRDSEGPETQERLRQTDRLTETQRLKRLRDPKTQERLRQTDREKRG